MHDLCLLLHRAYPSLGIGVGLGAVSFGISLLFFFSVFHRLERSLACRRHLLSGSNRNGVLLRLSKSYPLFRLRRHSLRRVEDQETLLLLSR